MFCFHSSFKFSSLQTISLDFQLVSIIILSNIYYYIVERKINSFKTERTKNIFKTEKTKNRLKKERTKTLLTAIDPLTNFVLLKK